MILAIAAIVAAYTFIIFATTEIARTINPFRAQDWVFVGGIYAIIQMAMIVILVGVKTSGEGGTQHMPPPPATSRLGGEGAGPAGVALGAWQPSPSRALALPVVRCLAASFGDREDDCPLD